MRLWAESVSVETTIVSQSGNNTEYHSTLSNGQESMELDLKVEQGTTTKSQTIGSLKQEGYQIYNINGRQVVLAKYDPNGYTGVVSCICTSIQGGFLDSDDTVVPWASTFFSIAFNFNDNMSNFGNALSIIGMLGETEYFSMMCDLIDRDPTISAAEKEQYKAAYRAECLEDWSILGASLLIASVVPGGMLASIAVGMLCTAIGGAIDRCDIIAGLLLLFTIDPSGYVYEAVEKKRLKGVKATITYRMSPEDEEKVWDATEYGQANPLYTDEDGAYAWDVPEGQWRVKFELEGYETAYSEWMPVPPEQTQVNIGMVSKSSPEVDSINAKTDKLYITFSQYMVPDSIRQIVLKDAQGNNVDYTLEYDESGKSADGCVYADQYALVYNSAQSVDSPLTVLIPDMVKSYNGKTVAAENRTVTVTGAQKITAADSISMEFEGEQTTEIKISNYTAGLDVLVSSSSAIGLPVSLGTIGADGKAQLTMKGALPGEYTVVIEIEGTTVTKEIKVLVAGLNEEPTPAPDPVPGPDPDPNPDPDPEPSVNPFDDVAEESWKYTSARYAYEKGIMTGKAVDQVTGKVKFAPDDNLTRAELAQMLYSMEGKPTTEYEETFQDVKSTDWFRYAVLWANENGVANGVGSNAFAPNGNITREQVATMLRKYAMMKEYDVSGSVELTGFKDADDVSSWATGNISWAVANGIISGKKLNDGSLKLDPKGNATRAECAAMLKKFCEKYVEE